MKGRKITKKKKLKMKMMKQIKFRAWDKTIKKMSFPMNVPVGKSEDATWVLMQFTGLLDKNGKEIYEGDVVKWNDGIFDLSWCNGGFKLMERKSMLEGAGDAWINQLMPFCQCFYDKNTNLEVIGNIYENPELIK